MSKQNPLAHVRFAPPIGVMRTQYHPLREIGKFFNELSPVGMERAMRLKFGPPRTHGSAESLRAWPRGRPGQGDASFMDRPYLLGTIKELKKYIGASQITRIG